MAAVQGTGAFLLIVISMAALWAALEFIPVLLHGYVLMVVAPFLARVAAVACMACGIGLLLQLFAFRLADVPDEAGEPAEQTAGGELEGIDTEESLA